MTNEELEDIRLYAFEIRKVSMLYASDETRQEGLKMASNMDKLVNEYINLKKQIDNTEKGNI